MDDLERFIKHTIKDNGCLLWTGYVNEDGYPHFRVKVAGKWSTVYAHRWIAGIARGKDLNDNEEAHHKMYCSRRCVNSDHLEVVKASDHRRYRNGRL